MCVCGSKQTENRFKGGEGRSYGGQEWNDGGERVDLRVKSCGVGSWRNEWSGDIRKLL